MRPSSQAAELSAMLRTSLSTQNHGRGTDALRRFAYQIGDMFLASPAWQELQGRGPDPSYTVDHVGKVTVRVPSTSKFGLPVERNDDVEGGTTGTAILMLHAALLIARPEEISVARKEIAQVPTLAREAANADAS